MFQPLTGKVMTSIPPQILNRLTRCDVWDAKLEQLLLLLAFIAYYLGTYEAIRCKDCFMGYAAIRSQRLYYTYSVPVLAFHTAVKADGF